VLILSLSLLAYTTESSAPNRKNNVQVSVINVQLGLSYLQQGNRVRAKQKLLQAVDQNSSSGSYGALAYFYETTSELKEAKQFYLKAIAEQPNAGAGHNNYGAFLCRQKQYQQADEQFQLAVNDPKYLNDAGAYENAGLCAMMVPNTPKAVGYFKKALQQNPKMSTSLEQLAQISYDQKQYQQALIYIQKYAQSPNVNAQGLGLGIKIALKLQKRNVVIQYTKILQQRFPKSKQFAQYKIYV
jgi:type IV pilus assembly protein PilF